LEKNAQHSNAMARYLHEKLKAISGIKVSQKAQSNGVWAIIPEKLAQKMQKTPISIPGMKKNRNTG
jgi:threonine aldolase